MRSGLMQKLAPNWQPNYLRALMALLIPDAATAWDEEIQRRVDALEAGTEKLESWESVKRRIATDILGR